MEQLHETFLRILNAALHGSRSDPPDDPRLYQLAHIHKVLPLIYGAAPHPSFRQIAFQQTAVQTVKTSEFLALYRHLSAAGLQPLVVKGIVCRSLYPNPDLRPSSDEDLLIPAEQFHACHDAMAAYGMNSIEDHGQYEIPYRKPGSPLYIELHKSLFPPDSIAYGSLNRFFDSVFEQAVTVSVQGIPIRTLCPTDHLFYLICHAFKHFLHSGFGIRQVCDIVLYASAYCGEIRWTEILENCRAIHADLFTTAIFKIGENHLGVPAPAVWADIPVDEIPLLNDILSSGIYGSATESRSHSSNITLNAVSGKQSGGLMASLFPSAKQLRSRYPYLQGKPWLLPVAWCSRIIHYGRQHPNATESLTIGNHRVVLLQQYGIIKKT